MTTDRLTQLLADGATPLIRSDFANDAAWTQVVAQVTAPVDFGGHSEAEVAEGDDTDYVPYVVPVDDPRFDRATVESVTSMGLPAGYLLLADRTSMADLDDLSVLYVSIAGRKSRSFRCAAKEIASIEANLSLANLDFEDFADNLDTHGVFRGFKSQERQVESVPEQLQGKAAAYAIAAGIGESGSVPVEQGGVAQVEATLTGTRRKLFPFLVRFCGLWGSDYTWSALGVPLVPGEVLYANCFNPDGERGDPIPGHGGYVLLTYATVESPSSATIAWNWYKPQSGESFAPRDHGIPVLADDSMIHMELSQLPRGNDVTTTTVKVTHRGIPSAWVPHMTAWWHWRLALIEHHKVGLQ